MKTPIEATYLYDIICTRQKAKLHPEEILNEIRKILVDEIWPESKIVVNINFFPSMLRVLYYLTFTKDVEKIMNFYKMRGGGFNFKKYFHSTNYGKQNYDAFKIERVGLIAYSLAMCSRFASVDTRGSENNIIDNVSGV